MPLSQTLSPERGEGVASSTTILWLGKLRRYKCPDHAIRAMVGVLKRVPRANLILAIRRDDETYEQELRTLANDLYLTGSVEFRVNVTEAEKHELMRKATVLVVPSAVEGFGIVVLEANASGVPVVASDGVPEGAVRDHYNGLRYRFGRNDELADALVDIILDDELHSRLSSNSLEFARQFRWSSVGARFEAIVKSAANRQPISAGDN